MTAAKQPRRKGSGWGPRTFTPEQWVRRDLRSAATRAEKDRKSGKRVITLATVNLPEDK